MGPMIDDERRAVGEELGADLKEFVKLHFDLAQTEMRDGWLRCLGGLVIIGIVAGLGILGVLALTAALYLVLDGPLSPAGAAAAVAAFFGLLCLIGLRVGLKLLSGVGSVFLPRTREMLWELLTWRDDRKNS
jgi:uncharacterized membrane protein YqjE